MAMQIGTVALTWSLVWADEFDWSPVQQSVEYAVTGAMYLQEGIRQAGRSITLSGHCRRSDLLALYALLPNPSNFSITLADGRTFTVRWKQDRPIQATAMIDYADPDPDDAYEVTLQLIVV
jgi:hypothetical protein